MTFFGWPPLLAGGIFAAVAAALAVLHLLRVRPREVTVPTLLFWKAAAEETRARTLLGRFRHPRTWLLLVALGGLIVLALAEPETEGSLAGRHHVILVVDAGATMGAPAAEGKMTRLERASALAREQLDQLPLAHEAALVIARPEGPEVLGFGTPRAALERALAAMKSPEAMANPDAMVTAAAGLAGGKTHASVRVFTDREPGEPIGGWPCPHTVVRVDSTLDDHALTGFGFDDGIVVRVSARGQFGNLQLRATREGTSDVVVPVDDVRDGIRWVRVPGIPPNGATVVLRLEPADAYLGNDRIMLGLPTRARSSIGFADEAARALTQLVQADADFSLAQPESAADLTIASAEDGPQVPDGAIVHEDDSVNLCGTDLPSPTPRLPPSARGLPKVGGSILLSAGDVPLARLLGGRLVIAKALLDPAGSWLGTPSGSSLLLRVIHLAKGDRDSQLPLFGASSKQALLLREGRLRSTMDHPLPRGSWMTGGTMESTAALLGPGPATNASAPREGDAGPERGPNDFRLAEIVTLLAVGLLVLDGVLQQRGRIA